MNSLNADATAYIQSLLDKGGEVIIPEGTYRITSTLKINSNTHVKAHKNARLYLCGDTPKYRGDFLLDNSDHINGNENITIEGGIWDGNNQGKYNTKDPDLFNPNAWSGSTMNFFRVKNLKLRDMVFANSVIYNLRMCRIDTFDFRNIFFQSDELAFNQDGLHFAGYINNGYVENVRALSKGQTNDDMLALNADDSIVRLENLDLDCGPIENIYFKDIYAEDCHTGVRLLSVDSPIRNITIDNMEVGVRCYAINMDGARYCRTPLFKEEDKPEGIGCIENVKLNNFKAHFTSIERPENPLICCEGQTDGFEINGFERSATADVMPNNPVLFVRNVRNLYVEINEEEKLLLKEKSDNFISEGKVSSIKINKL